MSCSRTQCSDAGEARTLGLWSQVKHSTTELLGSLKNVSVLKLPRFDVANIMCFTVDLQCIKLDGQIHQSEKV